MSNPYLRKKINANDLPITDTIYKEKADWINLLCPRSKRPKQSFKAMKIPEKINITKKWRLLWSNLFAEIYKMYGIIKIPTTIDAKNLKKNACVVIIFICLFLFILFQKRKFLNPTVSIPVLEKTKMNEVITVFIPTTAYEDAGIFAAIKNIVKVVITIDVICIIIR